MSANRSLTIYPADLGHLVLGLLYAPGDRPSSYGMLTEDYDLSNNASRANTDRACGSHAVLKHALTSVDPLEICIALPSILSTTDDRSAAWLPGRRTLSAGTSGLGAGAEVCDMERRQDRVGALGARPMLALSHAGPGRVLGAAGRARFLTSALVSLAGERAHLSGLREPTNHSRHGALLSRDARSVGMCGDSSASSVRRVSRRAGHRTCTSGSRDGLQNARCRAPALTSSAAH